MEGDTCLYGACQSESTEDSEYCEYHRFAKSKSRYMEDRVTQLEQDMARVKGELGLE